MTQGLHFSELGHDEFSNKRVLPDLKVVEIDHADLDAEFKYHIPVDAGTFVLGVGTYIKELFSGGAATMVVGDADDDSWATSALIVPATKDSFFMSLGSSVAHAQGLFFLTAGEIVVKCVTGLTAGKVKILIWAFSLAGNWRVADL